jgi:hypothetical protein
MDIDRLFVWAKPGPSFSVCQQIAEDIRSAARARFDESDWEQVIKPLNDQLREHQKLALIAYLLVQPDLIEWGVVDADSLFEFFLIDVQMAPCMQTSRIKQAISSVQSFIQRCLLSLEEPYGVPHEAIDRERWDWMQKYRVWEANRKVFLYPENWIDPELRDDKSPFYKELESELLQKDVKTQTVQDALNNYLFKVDEVANLQVAGLFQDDRNQKVHIFARTHNAPYRFFYRYYDINSRCWSPWEIMQVDIPSYDAEFTPTKPQSFTPAVTATVAAAIGATEPQSAAALENKLILYQLVDNRSPGAPWHYYTTSWNKRRQLITDPKWGMTDGGILCNVLLNQDSGSVAVYRFAAQNNSEYSFYSTDYSEVETSSVAFGPPGIAFYAFRESGANRIPVYWAEGPNTHHFYTTDQGEYKGLINSGWIAKGEPAWYGVADEYFKGNGPSTGNGPSLTENGTYLIPTMLDNRLFAFFPQFVKKTAAAKVNAGRHFRRWAVKG